MQNLLRLDKNNNLEYLFEIAIDIIAIIGTDSKIKRVSKSCNEILGWNEKEVISVEWSNFIHQDDLLRILGYKKTSNIKDEIKGLEFKVKCKDENYKLLKGNFKYIEEDKVYIVIAKDISEKQKILDEKLEGELTKKFPMLAMFMSEDMLKKIKNMIKTSILENKDTIIEMFSNYLEEKVSFRDIIITNVDGFSLEKLEDITYSLAKKELKHIEVVGAILGGIIGFFQFGVSLFM